MNEIKSEKQERVMYGCWIEWLEELKAVLVDRERRRAKGETELPPLGSFRPLQLGRQGAMPRSQRMLERVMRCPLCQMATLELAQVIPVGEVEQEASIYKCTWCQFDGQVVVLAPARDR
jgi:hypothetical protein